MSTHGLVGRFMAFALASTAWAQVTQRVNVSSTGSQASGSSQNEGVVVSDNGRYVVFGSQASDLIPGDANPTWDIFVRDRRSGTTELVSVDSNGVHGVGGSGSGTISRDGRFVAFASGARNLVPGDSNGTADVFVHDRRNGTTDRVSVASNGAQGNFSSAGDISLSDDGRYVAFVSDASTLVPADTNQVPDVFVHDRETGITERVSVDSNGGQSFPVFFNDQYSCDISADGRFVAFVSELQGLVSGDTNMAPDTFVHDRRTGATERVSVTSSGEQANYPCCDDFPTYCAISADGRFVAFTSAADNLAPGDANQDHGVWHHDVFVYDRQTRTTERISVDSSGAGGIDTSYVSDISGDGRYVAFGSYSRNLVPADSNGVYDLFVRDRWLATTERVNLGWGGAQANGGTGGASISSDGRYVAFTSIASNLVLADTNGWDVFVRDRFGGTNFTSLCDPGSGGVVDCPCANPPSTPDRGCDNSSGTGGAVLSASGGTYLSSDSLVFSTSGEKPSALSVVSQWTGASATGAIFGQGVRCTSGAVKRLYVKIASGGSITAPDFGEGDPAVSARSAAKGETIQLGQSRWYVVYYRDAIVLGGCPSSSTFNETQTGVVTWSP